MEDDTFLVPLSALQHYAYCPRQCALMYVEQTFTENVFTMKGRWAHARVDEEHIRSAGGNEILTALTVWSDKYGLTGRCDVVEMRERTPYPVEFKHGRLRAQRCDEIQLCAEAMCLEEMFAVPVLEGAIYHVSSRRRRSVQMTEDLRRDVLQTASAVRQLYLQSELPAAVNDARCVHCSLQSTCMPMCTDGTVASTWQSLIAGWKEDEISCTLD